MSEFGSPQNLYELMEQAAEAILTSPEHYYQDNWSEPARNLYPDKEVCGTAYCRAGWMENILGVSVDGCTARRLLHEAEIDRADLFLAQNYRTEYNADFTYELRRGSPEYATAGANGIKKFMARNKEQLLAARLVKRDGRWYVEKTK
jgi:hypothetical protein